MGAREQYCATAHDTAQIDEAGREILAEGHEANATDDARHSDVEEGGARILTHLQIRMDGDEKDDGEVPDIGAS